MHLRPLLVVLVLAVVAVAVPAAAGTTTAQRISDSGDPATASVLSSQATFADGSAEYVVVGRDDVFADNLAGTSLAGDRGPILYTQGGPDGVLYPDVLAEAQRVVRPLDSTCTTADAEQQIHVYLLGSENAVSTGVEQAFVDAGYCVLRLGGPSRFETALRIAEEVRRRYGSTDVLLARADDWADAATGGAYAAYRDIPVVVTPPDQLHPAVVTFYETAEPGAAGTTHLLGGETALSPAVADAVSGYSAVQRVAGAARDLTALAITEQLWGGLPGDGVTLLNGYAPDGWAYAFAAAPHSAVNGSPQVYTAPDVLIESTCGFLEATMPPVLHVAGDEGLVATEVEEPAVAVASGQVTCADLGQGGQPPAAGFSPLAVVVRSGGDHDTTPGLYLAAEDGSDPRLLAAGEFASRPSFYPDGDRVAVVEDVDGDGPGDRIVLVDTATGAVDPFHTAQPGFNIFEIAVNPLVGDSIVFERAQIPAAGDPVVDLFVASRTDLVPISEQGGVVIGTDPWGPDGLLTWAESGQVVAELGVGETRVLGQGFVPTYSPSGDIAYGSADGLTVTRPEAQDAFVVDPNPSVFAEGWFPDGVRLAATDLSGDATTNVYDLTTADGSGTPVLSVPGFDAAVSRGGLLAVQEPLTDGLTVFDGSTGARVGGVDLPATTWAYPAPFATS